MNELLNARHSQIVAIMRKRHPEALADFGVRFEPSECTVKSFAGRPDEIHCWATTDAVDMQGEVVLPDGLDVKSYLLKTRTVYLDHEYSPSAVVAKIRDMQRKGNGWISVTQLLDKDDDDVRALAGLAKCGMLRQSLGFNRRECGKPTGDESKRYPGAMKITRKSIGRELSFTTMPVNPDCTQIVMKSHNEKARAVLDGLGVKAGTYEAFKIPRGRVFVYCTT